MEKRCNISNLYLDIMTKFYAVVVRGQKKTKNDLLKIPAYIMGMFHWQRLVSNYRFLEGQEQCLQSRLGSVKVSRLIAVDQ